MNHLFCCFPYYFYCCIVFMALFYISLLFYFINFLRWTLESLISKSFSFPYIPILRLQIFSKNGISCVLQALIWDTFIIIQFRKFPVFHFDFFFDQFNIQAVGYFIFFFFLLWIYSSLWLEDIVWIISIFWNVLSLFLRASIWFILIILHVHLKTCKFWVLKSNLLKIYISLMGHSSSYIGLPRGH